MMKVIKKIISSIRYLLYYLAYRFIIIGMAIKCLILSLDHDIKKKSLRQDNPSKQIQFLLNLILSEGKFLKYSESMSVIYSLNSYTVCLTELLKENNKLNKTDGIFLDEIVENKMLDVNQKVIKLAQYIIKKK